MTPYPYQTPTTAVVITMPKVYISIIKDWARETILRDEDLPEPVKQFLFDAYQKLKEE